MSWGFAMDSRCWRWRGWSDLAPEAARKSACAAAQRDPWRDRVGAGGVGAHGAAVGGVVSGARLVCAWCGLLLAGSPDDSSGVTHGICEACFSRVMSPLSDHKEKGATR